MDHEQLTDDVRDHYFLLKAEYPELLPDELVTLIADRVGLDAELRLAAAEHAAGIDEGWSTIQGLVYAMEYGNEDGEPP